MGQRSPWESPVPTGLRIRMGHRDYMMGQKSPRESPVPTGLRDRTGHRDCNGTDGTEES